MLTYRKLDYRPWPITVGFLVCDETTGAVTEVEQSFIAHFKPFTEADLLEARRKLFGDEVEAEDRQRIADMAVAAYAVLEAGFFAALMCGWAQMTNEAGTPLPYSAEALTGLCCGPDGAAFRRGINRAVSEIRFGVAPAKNAETSPSPGPVPAAVEAASTS